MVEIHIAYQGELRCAATHMPSGTVLVTDAPKDNHGQGESFSPTDLVATALGSCMLTIMGITARKLALDLRGASVTVTKEMVKAPVRRIGRLAVEITVPLALDDAQRQHFIDAAKHCPVHYSLHPDIAVPVTFNWAAAATA
ncbi:MAG: OsmC family protein [Alphaproteobacteria bacterium]|nr:OsmC family protein [Alphaproteobacteria bacterium]